MPAGLEMMDAPAIRAAEAFAHCGYPLGRAPRCCSASSTACRARRRGRPARGRSAAASLRRHRVRGSPPTPTSASACGPDARRRFRPWAAWRPTTTAWTARSRGATSPRCCDASASCRRQHGLAGRQRVPRRRRQPAPADPVRCQRARRAASAPSTSAPRSSKLCVAVGGTVTGEHGVGVEKLGPMCSQFGAERTRGLPCA